MNVETEDNSIIFLGSWGGRANLGSQLRSSGGIIVRSGNIQMHIDPGPGALVRAKDFGVNLRNNDVVLCSHSHLDHSNDINVVIDAMTYSGLDQKGILLTSKSVLYGDEKERPYITRFHKKCVEKYLALGAGDEVDIGAIKVKALKTKHSDETGVGFKIFTGGFVLGYSGDTEYFKGIISELSDSDILLLNNYIPFNGKGDDHLSSEDSVAIIEDVKPKLAIIQHFGMEMLKANPVYEARLIQRHTGVQTIAARDGMIINPINYSASMKQKTLNLD